MTIKKRLPEDLEKRIKPCPVDLVRVENLLRRARRDLASAQRLSDSDAEAAYTLLYDCLLHAGLAYMAMRGVRPDVRGKHKTVIQYTAEALGPNYKSQMEFYDRMRRKRHLLIYEPGPYACTEKEMEEAEKIAKEFLTLISTKIKELSPQKELDL